jgi:hypothetical protein
MSHILTVVSSDADPMMACVCVENRTARTARACCVNFRRMDRLLMSNSCTIPACPPTASAFASPRRTPPYATSLNRANVRNALRFCELYTVTRADDVTASAYG